MFSMSLEKGCWTHENCSSWMALHVNRVQRRTGMETELYGRNVYIVLKQVFHSLTVLKLWKNWELREFFLDKSSRQQRTEYTARAETGVPPSQSVRM